MVLSRVAQCTACPTIHSSHVTHEVSLQALQTWNSFHILNWFHIHLVLITVLWDCRDSVIFPRLQTRKPSPRKELGLFYMVNTMRLGPRTGNSWFRAISTSNSFNPALREHLLVQETGYWGVTGSWEASSVLTPNLSLPWPPPSPWPASLLRVPPLHPQIWAGAEWHLHHGDPGHCPIHQDEDPNWWPGQPAWVVPGEGNTAGPSPSLPPTAHPYFLLLWVVSGVC